MDIKLLTKRLQHLTSLMTILFRLTRSASRTSDKNQKAVILKARERVTNEFIELDMQLQMRSQSHGQPQTSGGDPQFLPPGATIQTVGGQKIVMIPSGIIAM